MSRGDDGRVMQPDEAAQRALAQLGTSFRLHGRAPFAALDCIGLAGYCYLGCVGMRQLPSDYSLRGNHLKRIAGYISYFGLRCADPQRAPAAGDLLLLRPASLQYHLGIMTGSGLVHADAGLRRVVLQPDMPRWPVAACWHLPDT